MTLIVDGTSGVTFNDSSLQGAAASPFGLKNRIINGDMVIDQRNNGAAVTVNSSSEAFGLDRWRAVGQNTDGVFTVQRDTIVPAGFVNSTKITITTADSSIGSTQNYLFMQRIEGFNTADLNWGSANARTVTLSFWVRSSVTGTFGGAIRNDDGDYNYPFSYSISSANTYEFKTITITPPTTGTWKTNNATGIQVTFSLGSGSSLIGTANAWTTSNFFGVTGQTNLIATNGATWYVTGVQLERNTTATPFEWIPYGMELALCQRYFETNFSGVAIPTNNYSFYCTAGIGSNTYAGGSGAAQQIVGPIMYKVTKRASPTVTIYSWISSSTERVSNGWTGADFAANSGKLNISAFDGFSFYNNTGSNITTGGYSVIFNYTASAEL